MELNGTETIRLMEAAKHPGLAGTEILGPIRYIATGDERYLPER